MTNGSLKSVKGPMHGFDQHINVTLPPLSTIYFSVPASRKKADKPAEAAKTEPAPAAAEKTAPKKRACKPRAKAAPAAEKAPAKKTRTAKSTKAKTPETEK